MSLPTPRRGEPVTLIYVRDRTSYGSALVIDSVKVEGDRIVITAQHRATKALEGIDARLDNQRRTIQRLLDHLTNHCPQMKGEGLCPHIG